MNEATLADKVIARIMMVSFFLPMQLQPVGVFLSALYFIFRSFKSPGGVPVSNLAIAFLLGASYLLYLVALPFTPAEFSGVLHKLCEYRLGYLLLPVVFSLIARDKLAIIYNELVWFVYAKIAICVVTNIAFVAKYALAPGGFHGVTHVAYRVSFEEICGHHPTYMSMYLVMGAGYLLVRGQHLNRMLKYTMFYAIIAFLLPLLAKSPLIALALIMAHQAWLRRKTLWQYKWVFAGMLAVLVLSYLFVPFVSQRVQEMTGLSGRAMKGNVTDNSIYVRKMIWTVDTTLVKHYWLAGCGPGRLMHLLHVRYLFYSLHYGYDVLAYDPHNEYFYQWISFGLAGIVLLLAAVITHVVTSIKHKDFVYLYLILILIITFFTESVLATQHGLFFYSFFSSLFFFTWRGKRNVA